MTIKEIRPLTELDLDSIATIHIKAFSDRALAELGKAVVIRYYKWEMLGPHDAVALGVFDHDCLVAYCFAGVFRGALTGFLQKNKGFLVWRILTRPWLLLTSPLVRERIYLAVRLLKKTSDSNSKKRGTGSKSFGILAIAVDPDHQGKGIGNLLMKEIENIAIGRRYPQMHLTVNINNIQAIAFYENLSWQKILSPEGYWQGYMKKDI